MQFLRRALLVTLPVAALVGGACALVTHQPLAPSALVAALGSVAFTAFAALLILRHLLLAALVYVPSLMVLLLPTF